MVAEETITRDVFVDVGTTGGIRVTDDARTIVGADMSAATAVAGSSTHLETAVHGEPRAAKPVWAGSASGQQPSIEERQRRISPAAKISAAWWRS